MRACFTFNDTVSAVVRRFGASDRDLRAGTRRIRRGRAAVVNRNREIEADLIAIAKCAGVLIRGRILRGCGTAERRKETEARASLERDRLVYELNFRVVIGTQGDRTRECDVVRRHGNGRYRRFRIDGGVVDRLHANVRVEAHGVDERGLVLQFGSLIAHDGEARLRRRELDRGEFRARFRADGDLRADQILFDFIVADELEIDLRGAFGREIVVISGCHVVRNGLHIALVRIDRRRFGTASGGDGCRDASRRHKSTA